MQKTANCFQKPPPVARPGATSHLNSEHTRSKKTNGWKQWVRPIADWKPSAVGGGGLLWPKIVISYGGLSRRRPYWARLPRTGADGSLATFLPRNVRHSGSANTLIMCAIGSIVRCSRLVCERLKHRRLFAPALAVLSALIGRRNRGVRWGHLSRMDVLSSVSLLHFVPSKYFEMSSETGWRRTGGLALLLCQLTSPV